MSEVVIRVNRFSIERIIYWIIILVLAGMLIWSYIYPLQDSNETQEVINQTTPQEDIEVQEEEPVQEQSVNQTTQQEESAAQEEIIEEENSLSGEVSLSVSNVELEEISSGAVRVSSFSVEIENGLEQNIIPQVQAFVESINGNLLNQANGGSIETYIGPVTISPVASGETLQTNIDQKGIFLWDDQTGYDFGDDFRLVVEIIDNDGNSITTATHRVSP